MPCEGTLTGNHVLEGPGLPRSSLLTGTGESHYLTAHMGKQPRSLKTETAELLEIQLYSSKIDQQPTIYKVLCSVF